MRKVHALLGLVCLIFPVVGCKPEADRIRDKEAVAAIVPPKEPEMPDQVAKVGVGVQGNSLDDIKGNDPRMLIAGPAKALFNTKEKIVFDIELPRSAQLYNALHDGKDPKTHEEYMKEVVGQIKLPKLPPGKVYRYHPETNELWVESEKPTEPSKP